MSSRRYSDAFKTRVVAAYAAGLSAAVCASRFRVNARTVRAWAQAAGVRRDQAAASSRYQRARWGPHPAEREKPPSAEAPESEADG